MNYTSTNQHTQYDYPLEWLDLLVTKELNPLLSNSGTLIKSDINELLQQLSGEQAKLEFIIKAHIFSLHSKSEIRLSVTRYYSSLIILLDLSLDNQKLYDDSTTPAVKTVNQAAIKLLQALCLFIETRFSSYLTADEKVPANYLENSKRELRKRITALKRKTDKVPMAVPVMTIVYNAILKHINSGHPNQVTFRDIEYLNELIKKLEELRWDAEPKDQHYDLCELLFYMNFNAKEYIKYLTDTVTENVKASQDKLATLLFYYKTVKQLKHRPDYKFNAKFYDLGVLTENWLTEEILYHEKKLNTAQPSQKQASKKTVSQKVMCVLSTDQIALIIRSADEARVLVSKSMNEVFKSIIPHLSTPHKEELSFDSVRSKSYIAEEKDKQIAIATLERMIKKIKGY